MRVIKFRVWDRACNCMITNESDSKIYLTHGVISIGEVWATQDCELMQYTGLTDKKGKEIYEGDVVKSQDDEGDYATYKDVIQVVEFDTGSFYPVSEKYSKYFEVIGNIYENPALLDILKEKG